MTFEVPLLNFVLKANEQKPMPFMSFSCARGLSKLKSPKYSTKADQNTFSSELQPKTAFELKKNLKPQSPETTTN